MAVEPLTIRISATGAREVKRDLEAIGTAGQRAAANQNSLNKNLAATGKNAQGVRTVNREVTTLGGTVKSAGIAVSNLRTAFAGLAAFGVAGIFAGAVKSAAAFETSMAEISTILKDQAGLPQLNDAIRETAVLFGQAPTAQATALYQIVSAGAQDAAQATDLLTAANKLAIGGLTDVTTAADGLTSIMNAYGSEAGSATEVSDRLFATVRAGKTTIGELSSAVGSLAPLAAQAGVSLDEMLAATAALTLSGQSTSEAMTGVRGAIQAIIKPSSQARDLAADLGIEFNAQALQAKGLEGVLDDVARATGGSTEQMGLLFGEVEGLKAVMALTGNQAQQFAAILDDMSAVAGLTEEAFAKLSDTAEFRFNQARAAITVAGVDIGNTLLKGIVPALELMLENMELIRPVVLGLVTALGVGLVGALAAVIGPLGLLAGALAAAAVAGATLAERFSGNADEASELATQIDELEGNIGALTRAQLENARVGFEIALIQQTERIESLNREVTFLAAELRKFEEIRAERGFAGLIDPGLFFKIGNLRQALNETRQELQNTAGETFVTEKALFDIEQQINSLEASVGGFRGGVQETLPPLQDLGFVATRVSTEFGALKGHLDENTLALEAQFRLIDREAQGSVVRLEEVADAGEEMGSILRAEVNETAEFWRGSFNDLENHIATFFKTGDLNAGTFFESLKNRAIDALAGTFTTMVEQAAFSFLEFMTGADRQQNSFWDSWRAKVGEGGDFFGTVITKARDLFFDFLSSAGGMFDRFFDNVIGGLQNISGPGLLGSIGTAIKTVTLGFSDAVFKGIKAVGSFLGFADGGLVEAFASGGVVSGPGGPREDRVPAMLSAGEFVVNAASTEKFLPLLTAINDNRVPGFQSGGTVGGSEDLFRDIDRAAGTATPGAKASITGSIADDIASEALLANRAKRNEIIAGLIGTGIFRSIGALATFLLPGPAGLVVNFMIDPVGKIRQMERATNAIADFFGVEIEPLGDPFGGPGGPGKVSDVQRQAAGRTDVREEANQRLSVSGGPGFTPLIAEVFAGSANALVEGVTPLADDLIAGGIALGSANFPANLPGISVPGLRHGGPLGRGRPAIVGEGGPEMFIPGQSGRVVPLRGRGAGGSDEVIRELRALRNDTRETLRRVELAIAELHEPTRRIARTADAQRNAGRLSGEAA